MADKKIFNATNAEFLSLKDKSASALFFSHLHYISDPNVYEHQVATSERSSYQISKVNRVNI